MPSIGGVPFFSVRHNPSPPGERTQRITRPHVDGMAVRKLGVKGEPYRLFASADVLDNTARVALIASMKALSGTIPLAGIVDDHGETTTGILIGPMRHTTTPVKTSVGGLLGSGATKWVVFDIECTDTRAS